MLTHISEHVTEAYFHLFHLLLWRVANCPGNHHAATKLLSGVEASKIYRDLAPSSVTSTCFAWSSKKPSRGMLCRYQTLKTLV